MQFVIQHSTEILATLLGVSELVALWAGKGGIIVALMGGLRSLGAKEPSELVK